MDVQGVLFIVLAVSVVLSVLSQLYLWWFLRRRHVQMCLLFVGTPGYLDIKYIRWSQEHQSAYLAVIIARALLALALIFVVVAIQQTLKGAI
jgi:hypothetical protein